MPLTLPHKNYINVDYFLLFYDVGSRSKLYVITETSLVSEVLASRQSLITGLIAMPKAVRHMPQQKVRGTTVRVSSSQRGAIPSLASPRTVPGV